MGQRKASSDEFKDLESDPVEVPSDTHRKLRRLIRLLEQERQSDEEEQYFAERLLSVAPEITTDNTRKDTA